MTDKTLTGNSDDQSASAPVHRVLARKYRPQVFDALVGQDAMVRTLRNGFEAGRIAQAYMLTGVRGIGKTTTARLIARALNYDLSDAPTLDMPAFGAHCEAILRSGHVDVLEMDAASRTGVNDIREIIESVGYKPISARYKVYIIDEVHMLSTAAFNALLKTLEEPPEHVKFIFATTEIRKVPMTILSRCQRFDLRRLSAAALAAHLGRIARAENVEAEEDALRLIARASGGSVRDGLSLLDQAIAYGRETITAQDAAIMLGVVDQSRLIDLFELVMKGDIAASLAIFAELHAGGGDPCTMLSELAEIVHWVSRAKVTGDAGDDGRSQEDCARISAFAQTLVIPHLTRAWQILLNGSNAVAASDHPAAAAEMLLIRLVYAANLPGPEDLARSLGDPAATAPSPAPTTSAPAPEAAPRASTPMRSITCFTDIVELAERKRDLKLKDQLTRYARPIRVAPGTVEMALEDNAPPRLAQIVSKKLRDWTGQHWMVSVAASGGETPLAVQEGQRREDHLRRARNHSAVAALLRDFPEAEIINVTFPRARQAD